MCTKDFMTCSQNFRTRFALKGVRECNAVLENAFLSIDPNKPHLNNISNRPNCVKLNNQKFSQTTQRSYSL
jgi:hypothetical protein